MCKLFALALCATVVFAAPSPHCKRVIHSVGLSTNYNETIAHAVHSMTVEALQVFHPSATVNNHVPTVNQDLSGSQKVLPYAPDSRTGHDFSTQTMNIVDNILSQLGHAKDGLGPNWSGIERVAHTFHMWDLWLTIHRTEWQNVIKAPPSHELCACLTDVENNGVTAAVKWVADHYETGTPITLLNRPIPKLTDSNTWSVWKDRLLHYYTPAALRDAAIYLYCAA